MHVEDFDFHLPDELIAQHPPRERGASRLLVLWRATGAIEHTTFRDLSRLLTRGDLLVANDTRVYPARLLGRRVPSGGAVECLIVGNAAVEDGGEPAAARQIGREATMLALVHPGQKLKPGARVEFERDGVRLEGEILARHYHGRRTVRLWTTDGGDVTSAVDRIGHVPLPPYIKRADEPADRERYQTVFARHRGSVAAPTAGLHFTEELLAELDGGGIRRATITLHVGYGTFKPVRVEQVEEHRVDPESFTVPPATATAITSARREGRRVIAVGTTTVRALESLAIDATGGVDPASGSTGLFIHPGHEFRIVSGLITNFHLPRSSLLMLVCAFGGRERVLAAYREAVASGYRFYSYGDAMLLV